ncbi:MAG: alkaline phosphatase family protein [Myxococcota bacterium]
MSRLARFAVAVALVGLWTPAAHAYIGPGAGFAFAGSLLVLVAAFALAIGTILLWPITFAWKTIRVGNPFKHALAKRIIVLGLDGMDPGLATKFMLEGRMPNFRKLADKGVFRPLDTSNPSMSPVAWSTFATGVDPSRHGIFDFLTRDPCTYAPMLSSTDIGQAEKVVNIGKYVVPLSKPRIKLLQKSQHFWKLLGEKHIFSIIQRVPITFPPVPFRGLLLSGMCVPDLRGSQGTFSFFSTRQDEGGAPAFTGGEQTILRRKGNVIRSRIVGPDNGMVKGGGRMTLPFTLTVGEGHATLEIDGGPAVPLKPETYSPWITLSFKAAPGVTVSGIARFYLTSLQPDVNLYMTPIHIDPENPAMPISHPEVYAVYLAKKFGPYATLGLAEDTWALNERVIDEKAFFQAAMDICEEREKMFFDAVSRVKKGLVTTVFDTTDRVQHMFYRYLDPTHPANAGKPVGGELSDAIQRVYDHADGILGRLLAEVGDDPDTVVMVISDHGFTNFRRGVNLNAWLRDEGYLVLKDGELSGEWFENVDWSRTKAFSLGLTGLFVNRKGREKSGIVAEGEEYRALVNEIARKLEQLVDPATGERAIRKVEIAPALFDGPYRFDAPDLLVGYEGGYRNSWECATGSVTREVFTDNTKSWSGDHCVDPAIVPGVFFCNRPVKTETPRLLDIPFSILSLFGQKPPKYMQGAMIFGDEAVAKGMLDPATLSQSGAAPGARVVRVHAAS